MTDDSSSKVVITGMSVITPIGLTLEESWGNLCKGKSGINKIYSFDANNLKCQVAGEVKGFDPEKFLDKKIVRRTDKMQQFFLVVANQAMKDAQYSAEDKDKYKLSVIGTSCLGSTHIFEENHKILLQGHLTKVSPFLILNLATNVIAGDVAKKYSFKGPQHFIQEACASGTKAIGLAYKLIKMGEIDAALVVASESAISPLIISALNNLTAIVDDRWNNVPYKASRPFDRKRCGFVPSEGAGAIFIERLSSAVNRGAKIYAEVAGFGATTDSSHSISPNLDGEAIINCMNTAITDANVSLTDVDYINAHGTSTQINDFVETYAIKKLFGKIAFNIPISSNKSMIGHLWAAAGMVESIFSVKSIIDGIIPPTINLDEPDPECDLNYVPNQAQQKEISVVLKNSFGFGGVNASLVLRKFDK
jgi:3-oxoacyl-[acyl-carrier-protein] synthase II